jgi:hypothetical protein
MAGVGKKDRHQWTTTLTHVAHEFHCAREILSQMSEEASGGSTQPRRRAMERSHRSITNFFELDSFVFVCTYTNTSCD